VTLQLIMDSLRYWLTEMHVDGYRFDLAPSLARQEGGFDGMSAFFDLVAQDPVVPRAKLIAEPWDVGQMDSYDLGRFPPLWREWNGRYRDSMRDFWRSHQIGIGEFATRFCGSADLYGGAERRRPTASVNLFTVHDGLTLTDLVSYNDKHNEANGESNRDGTDDNRSWNCGAEGPTTDPDILALRMRQRRAMLTTQLLSFGVPMLLGGRARPHPAGQQQRLLPGQRHHLVRLVVPGRRTAGLHPAPDRVPQGAPGVPPQPLPLRGAGV
jgi:glycogen operon protein